MQGQKDFRQKLLPNVKMLLIWFKHYYFTFMALTIVFASTKNLMGSLRPHFFALCSPDLATNCTIGQYISSEFKCMNPLASEYQIFDVSRSFPSGHVVVSVFSTVSLMWYLHNRISDFPLLLAFTHLISILWMMLCAVTRITDNFHHVHDVIGGFLLTLPFVIYLVSKLKFCTSSKLRVFVSFHRDMYSLRAFEC